MANQLGKNYPNWASSPVHRSKYIYSCTQLKQTQFREQMAFGVSACRSNWASGMAALDLTDRMFPGDL